MSTPEKNTGTKGVEGIELDNKDLKNETEIKSNETYRAFIVVVINGVRLIDNIQL